MQQRSTEAGGIGFGAKAVVTGDVTQIDLQRGQKSGLVEARRSLAGVRGIAFTDFTAADVARNFERWCEKDKERN